jgi:hypothetical protein
MIDRSLLDLRAHALRARRMLVNVVLLLSLLVGLAAGFGCASAGLGRGVPDDFPTAEALRKIAARPAPAAVRAAVRADATSWTLQGPFPDRFGDAPIARRGQLDDLLIEALGAERTSENARCAARELGHARASLGKWPDERLEGFILGRCGVSVARVSFQSLSWDRVPDSMTDDAIWAEARGELKRMFSSLAQGSRGEDSLVGVVFLRDRAQGTAEVFGIAARRTARLAPVSQLVAAEATAFVLEGSLTSERAETAYAYVGQGLLGAIECTRDESRVLPAFRFTCPLAPGDVHARIDVTARDKGRVLGNTAAQILVVRDLEASAAYRKVIYAETHAELGEADALGARILDEINRVRASADAPPLRNTAAQSATATRVAPHYFGNLFAEDFDTELGDVLALGLMAGWDVDEITIHDAGFVTLLDSSGGLDDLLGSALDLPSTRSMLLGKDATAAAIAPYRVADGVTGVVVVTYVPLAAVDHEAAAKQVFAKLDRTRRERGLDPLGEIPTEAIMLAAAQRMQAGEDVDAVAQQALKQSVDAMQRPFTLWTMEVYDVEHMAFPDDLLSPRKTYIAVSVATRKRPRSAWGSTVVLVLGFVDKARVARAETRAETRADPQPDEDR